MAALTTPHWEAATPGARDLLALLGQLSLLRPFYLAGGTALALRLGHRISQDLDLFANKDFYDLYFIASRISLDELFARSSAKYPESRSFGMRVLTALVDFGIADQQDEPTMLQPVEWDRVKALFVTEARRLGQEWFGQG